jgi:hypothetical protein
MRENGKVRRPTTPLELALARPTRLLRDNRTTMRKELMNVTLVSLLSLVQAAPIQVKVENHSLGETAETFFSEGREGVLLNACGTKDLGKINRPIKETAKEYCAWLSNVRLRMVGGENGSYKDELSADDTKTTTYAFAAGKFVAAEIVFIAPDSANNNQGKSFAEVLSGLKGTYGAPTSQTIVPYHNVYGVLFDRHQNRWLTESYVIQMDEQPGAHGWTSVKVWTREAYDKLQTEKSTKPPPSPLN